MLQGAHTNVLPIGYTQLAFLASTGTQYIDTGLHIDNGSVIKVDCEYGSAAAAANGAVFGFQNTGITQDRAGWSEFATGTQGWIFWGWLSSFQTIPSEPNERHSVELSRAGFYYNGVKLRDVDQGAFKTSGTCWLFARNTNASVIKYHGKIYSFSFSQDGKQMLNFIPCMDDKGEPCMFDTVTRHTFKNVGTGEFIAGMTLSQARKLGTLPAGTSLTVSLPVGWQEDEGVVNAIAQATEKGCVITQADDWSNGGSAASSSFALRRAWVRKTQDANGSYVDADNARWQVEWCVDVIGADPESLGYERFRSVEVAAEYWGLTPYVDPETETIES